MLFRLQIRFIFSILSFILLFFQTCFKRNYTTIFCAKPNNTILLISLALIIISTSLYNSNLSFSQNSGDNSDVDNSDVDNSDVDNSDVDNSDVDNSDVDSGDNSASEFFSSSDDDTTTLDNEESNVPLLSDLLEKEPRANIQPSSPNPSISEELSTDLENVMDPNALNNQLSSLDNGMFVPGNNHPSGDIIVNPNLKALNLRGVGPEPRTFVPGNNHPSGDIIVNPNLKALNLGGPLLTTKESGSSGSGSSGSGSSGTGTGSSGSGSSGTGTGSSGSGSGTGTGTGSGSGTGTSGTGSSGTGTGSSGTGTGTSGSGSGTGTSGTGSSGTGSSGTGTGSSGTGTGSSGTGSSGTGTGTSGTGPNEPIKPEKHFDTITTVDLNITDTEKIKTDVGGQPIPFQYIVIFDDKITTNPNSLATTFQGLSLIVESLGGEIIFTYNNTISGIAFKTVDQQKSDQILNILSLDPRVKFAEQDKIVVPFSQVVPNGIQRIGIENVAMDSDIEQVGIDTDIAIIDSGIDLDHPDLNVFKNVTSIIPQILSSEDNTIRAKDIDLNKIGLNVKNNLTTFYPPFFQESSSTGDDNCGHGTHVAGIAAAKDNAFGVVGIAPGAKLWAIKVLDYDKNSGKCFGSISSVIAAIDYVTKNADQIDVVNLSLGCKCNSTALDEAISKSVIENVVYVTAAGNIHTDASSFSPANHKDVLTVSAIADADGKCGSLGTPIWVDAGDYSGFSNDDTFAFFSNYGSVVDMAAPGVKINSTYINGTYALMGGTSIASPHVTGMVALYKSINPTASPKEISEKLMSVGLHPNAVCDGYSYGYFDQDLDNSPEPLLHSFDMVNIKVDDSHFKGDPNFWNTFSDIT
jgi:hypothetical protein